MKLKDVKDTSVMQFVIEGLWNGSIKNYLMKRHWMILKNCHSRAQHGLSPSGTLINMHKIAKIASVGFDSQLLANI